jgi:hypothetical protein
MGDLSHHWRCCEKGDMFRRSDAGRILGSDFDFLLGALVLLQYKCRAREWGE